MKCVKCGQNINEDLKFCNFCGAQQPETEAGSGIGQAMRKLYKIYGAEKILTDNGLLVNGLLDFIPDNNIMITRLKLAMNCGLGKVYFHQISHLNKPDPDFTKTVIDLLTNDAGLSDKAAAELIGCFDDMIGWEPRASSFLQNDSTQNKNEIQTQKRTIEEYKQIKAEADKSQEPNRKEGIYCQAIRKMAQGNLADLCEAQLLLSGIPGYKNADDLLVQCKIKIQTQERKIEEQENKGTGSSDDKPTPWGCVILIILQIFAIIMAFYSSKSG